MSDSLSSLYSRETEQLRRVGRRRALAGKAGLETVVDFSTNDYLGLSHHPDVIRAAQNYAAQYGAGSTGARLLSGDLGLHLLLEDKIACTKQTETALTFPSGYQANATVLAALLDERVLGARAIVYFDKLNHASLYHAVQLSGAELIRYRHNDLAHLKACIDKNAGTLRPQWIVSETVFGMDGDVANVPALIDFARAHDCGLYLDEAHATGVMGDDGYGLAKGSALKDIPYVIMGTFSKAVGVSGAYVATTYAMRDYCINRCTGFIYSTALPPMVVGAVNAAWDLIAQMKSERAALQALGTYVRDQLQARGLSSGTSATHIIPIVLGDDRAVMDAKNRLAENGVIVSAVRPPTVPPGTARLRLSLTAKHTAADVALLFDNLPTLQAAAA